MPMATACMIWQAMLGNGVLIGMAKTIIATRHYVILKVLAQVSGVFYEAVLGTVVRATCVWLAVPTTFHRLPTPTVVFVVCQDSLLRSSRLTLVLS